MNDPFPELLLHRDDLALHMNLVFIAMLAIMSLISWRAKRLATPLILLAFTAGTMAETSTSPGNLPAQVFRNGKAEVSMKAFGARFVIGAAIPGAELNEKERQLLFQHFGAVTPENNMKPGLVQPREGQFSFGPADRLVEMAVANDLFVNGHTLIWHQQCPDWFFLDGDRPAGRELVLARMRDHIAAVAGRYAGKVKSWDVVNEAIDDGSGYLRQSKWLTQIGEDFIAEAFLAARRADPHAELIYNDYHIEGTAKRAKALRLIRELRQRNVPIDGIGIQGHWQLDRIPYAEIEEAIIAFHAEGMQVMITELDIDVVPRELSGADIGAGEKGGGDPFVLGLTPEVQLRLAEQYARLFALFFKHDDKISRVTFWGLHDGRSWLNNWPRRRTNHPLFWDRELQPKPAFSAVLRLVQQEH